MFFQAMHQQAKRSTVLAHYLLLGLLLAAAQSTHQELRVTPARQRRAASGDDESIVGPACIPMVSSNVNHNPYHANLVSQPGAELRRGLGHATRISGIAAVDCSNSPLPCQSVIESGTQVSTASTRLTISLATAPAQSLVLGDSESIQHLEPLAKSIAGSIEAASVRADTSGNRRAIAEALSLSLARVFKRAVAANRLAPKAEGTPQSKRRDSAREASILLSRSELNGFTAEPVHTDLLARSLEAARRSAANELEPAGYRTIEEQMHSRSLDEDETADEAHGQWGAQAWSSGDQSQQASNRTASAPHPPMASTTMKSKQTQNVEPYTCKNSVFRPSVVSKVVPYLCLSSNSNNGRAITIEATNEIETVELDGQGKMNGAISLIDCAESGQALSTFTVSDDEYYNSHSNNSLASDQSLEVDQSLFSSNGLYRLTLTRAGALKLIQGPHEKCIWSNEMKNLQDYKLRARITENGQLVVESSTQIELPKGDEREVYEGSNCFAGSIFSQADKLFRCGPDDWTVVWSSAPVQHTDLRIGLGSRPGETSPSYKLLVSNKGELRLFDAYAVKIWCSARDCKHNAGYRWPRRYLLPTNMLTEAIRSDPHNWFDTNRINVLGNKLESMDLMCAQLENRDVLRSTNGRFSVFLSQKGSLVMKDGNRTLWDSLSSNLAHTQPPYALSLSQDGYLAIRDSRYRVIWTPMDDGLKRDKRTGWRAIVHPYRLEVTDDGMLAVFDGMDNVKWSTWQQASNATQGGGLNTQRVTPSLLCYEFCNEDCSASTTRTTPTNQFPPALAMPPSTARPAHSRAPETTTTAPTASTASTTTTTSTTTAATTAATRLSVGRSTTSTASTTTTVNPQQLSEELKSRSETEVSFWKIYLIRGKKCLDVTGATSESLRPVVKDCDQNESQLWSYEHDSGHIKNKLHEKCLTRDEGQRLVMGLCADDAPLARWEANPDNPGQIWARSDDANCLDGNSADQSSVPTLSARPCWLRTDYRHQGQKWRFLRPVLAELRTGTGANDDSRLIEGQKLASTSGRFFVIVSPSGNLEFQNGTKAVAISQKGDSRSKRSPYQACLMDDGRLVIKNDEAQLWNETLEFGLRKLKPPFRMIVDDNFGRLQLEDSEGFVYKWYNNELFVKNELTGLCNDGLNQLLAGQSLTSENGKYKVALSPNGVLFHHSANEISPPADYQDTESRTSPFRAVLKHCGRIVVENDRMQLWSIAAAPGIKPPFRLSVDNLYGRLQLQDKNNITYWWSNNEKMVPTLKELRSDDHSNRLIGGQYLASENDKFLVALSPNGFLTHIDGNRISPLPEDYKTNKLPYQATLKSCGSLLIETDETHVWSMDSPGGILSPYKLTVDNENGRLQLQDSNNHVYWWSDNKRLVPELSELRSDGHNTMLAGQYLFSENGKFSIALAFGGYFFHKGGINITPITDVKRARGDYRALLDKDGNLLVLKDNKPIWTSADTKAAPATKSLVAPFRLRVDNELGRMQLQDANNYVYWWSDNKKLVPDLVELRSDDPKSNKLHEGRELRSPNGRHYLQMTFDGSLKSSGHVRIGPPDLAVDLSQKGKKEFKPFYLSLNPNGELTIGNNDTQLWSSGVPKISHPPFKFTVDNLTGNLQLFDQEKIIKRWTTKSD